MSWCANQTNCCELKHNYAGMNMTLNLPDDAKVFALDLGDGMGHPAVISAGSS